MPVMFFFVFIIGLILGSFFNVLGDRLPQGKSILGRSSCDSCHHILSWMDLIPVISFLLLRGKCRYCHKNFSVQYPFSEIGTGVLFLLIFFKFQDNIFIDPINFILNLFFASILIIIFLSDLKYRIIPDIIVFPSIVVVFISLVLTNQNLIPHLLTGTVAFLFFLFIHIITKGNGMGFGDVKFSFLIGLFLDFLLAF